MTSCGECPLWKFHWSWLDRTDETPITPKIANGNEPEWRGDSKTYYDEACQCRSDGATDIDADAGNGIVGDDVLLGAGLQHADRDHGGGVCGNLAGHDGAAGRRDRCLPVASSHVHHARTDEFEDCRSRK